MAKWLILYSTHDGAKAAIINDPQGTALPFGADLTSLGLSDLNAVGAFIVELPAEGERPLVVEVESDQELAVEFIDL